MVHRSEEPEPEVPGGVIAEDRARGARILGEPPGEEAVDRRAEQRKVLCLTAEDVSLQLARGQAASASSAAFACSATAANACGSETAMSESDLRSSSIPALCKPEMN